MNHHHPRLSPPPDVSPYTWRCAPSVRVKDSKHQGKQQNAGEPVCVRHIRLPENATEVFIIYLNINDIYFETMFTKLSLRL